jgi:hypothetical protein
MLTVVSSRCTRSRQLSMLLMSGLVLALALPGRAAEPDTTLIPRIDSLIERIGNPVVKDAGDLRAVRRLCDSCLDAARDLRTSDPALDAAARDLYDVAYSISEAFLGETYEPVDTMFMLAAPGIPVNERAEVARIMVEEYGRVRSVFADSVGINAPAGRVVVLVPVRISDEFTELVDLGKDRVGAITALCKWVMTPVEVARGSEMKEGYPRLREYLRHELTHVFVNSAAGAKTAGALPVWFDEMVTTNTVGIRRGLARSYKEYLALGRHIRSRFGDRKYHEFVRRVIETGSAETALKDLFGYESYAALRAEFSRSARKRDLKWWAAALAALVALFAFVRMVKFLRLRNEFRAELAAARAAWTGGKWHEAVNGYDRLGTARHGRFITAPIRAERAERRPAALAREFDELLHRAEAAHNQKDWEHTVQFCGSLLGERFASCRPEKAMHRIHDLWLSSEFRTVLWQARKAFDAADWPVAADCYGKLQDEKFDPVRHLARENEIESRAPEARANALATLLSGLRDALAAGDRDRAIEHAYELSQDEYADLVPDEEKDTVNDYAEEYEDTDDEENT